MRHEHINVGDELYYASPTAGWRERRGHARWGRAVITTVVQAVYHPYVACDVYLWHFDELKRGFVESPKVQHLPRETARMFRGPWRTVFDETHEAALALHIGILDRAMARQAQRDRDYAVAAKAWAIGLDCHARTDLGRVTLTTVDMAAILDRLDPSVRFTNRNG